MIQQCQKLLWKTGTETKSTKHSRQFSKVFYVMKLSQRPCVDMFAEHTFSTLNITKLYMKVRLRNGSSVSLRGFACVFVSQIHAH